jgi:hypothetical protein
MEIYDLKEDLNVMGLQLKKFPDGIGELFDELITRIPGGFSRSYYGISRMNRDNEITYYATAEKLGPEEPGILKLNEYAIEKGRYLTVRLHDWRKNLQNIKATFTEILKDERADHQKPCVEWYKNEQEMLCMVKMK